MVLPMGASMGPLAMQIDTAAGFPGYTGGLDQVQVHAIVNSLKDLQQAIVIAAKVLTNEKSRSGVKRAR
jgi:hypothetical protein